MRSRCEIAAAERRSRPAGTSSPSASLRPRAPVRAPVHPSSSKNGRRCSLFATDQNRATARKAPPSQRTSRSRLQFDDRPPHGHNPAPPLSLLLARAAWSSHPPPSRARCPPPPPDVRAPPLLSSVLCPTSSPLAPSSSHADLATTYPPPTVTSLSSSLVVVVVSPPPTPAHPPTPPFSHRTLSNI